MRTRPAKDGGRRGPCEAVDAATGQVAKRLPTEADQDRGRQREVVEVDGDWADAQALVARTNRTCTDLRTTVRVDGKPIDVQ